MKILYLTASPQFVELEEATADGLDEKEYPKLDLWPELQAVSDALFEARSEGFADIEVVPEVRRQDLQRYLGRRQLDVLHFSGHGDRSKTPAEENSGQSAALLFNHEFGYGEFVPNDWLKAQLAGKDIDVVILNCCWSDAVAESVKDEVGVVIGTTSPLRSDDARSFSEAFYETLQSGATLGEARDAARKTVGPDLYKFYPPDGDPVWQRVIPPPDEDEADEETIGLLDLADRFDSLDMKTYWRYLDWDIAKIVLGVMLALVSYEFIDTVNSLAEEYEEGHSLWGDFLKYLADADRESDWLKFEPIAILIAFSARPLSKLLVSPFLFLFGPFIADAVKALSLRPRAYIEAELSQEQREKVSEWLQEFER